MACLTSLIVSGGDYSDIKFKDNGKFKILMISDIHGGKGYAADLTVRDIDAIVETEKPDLVIMGGDIAGPKVMEHIVDTVLYFEGERRYVVVLKETIELMKSDDYKDRFKAEYYQTKIRYERLHVMLVKYEAGTLGFEPTCPITLLREQAGVMGAYLYNLEVRAQMEGIEL